jgi:hypothetical protein
LVVTKNNYQAVKSDAAPLYNPKCALVGPAPVLAGQERKSGSLPDLPPPEDDTYDIDDDAHNPEDDLEVIYNGELCTIIKLGTDFIDVEFEENCDGIRRVRLILNDGFDASGCLPNGTAHGYAMSVHKGQGSQFKIVILVVERGNPRYGIVQRSNVYTGTSRAIEKLVIVGNFDDYVQAALTPDLPRNTLLCDLLIGRGKEASRAGFPRREAEGKGKDGESFPPEGAKS